ncbi:AAA family ATPase, partial [Paenarthrobacter nicotinovorans]|uniref:AAA family ATPase n=1 Tax=Paenarthrobacter nicotinovorans TaxID=29320 RepID=UPI0038046E12
MSQPDLLRPSRDGDQFHYAWAARQSLRLLDATSGLDSLFVEAVDPSEHPDVSQPADLSGDEQTRTGDEVIDLAEYWGSSTIEHATKVVYRQFKHSTRYANDPWTLSFLTKTLIGFARKYTTLKTNHPAALDCVYFEFISNRPPADSAIKALSDLQNGNLSPATKSIRERLTKIISTEDLRLLCERLTVDERAPSLLKLRHLLDLDVADLLPGAPGEQALLLREMISSRATSVAGDNPMVRRADVLASLKTSEDLLLPAPNLIEAPKRSIDRHQFGEIAAKVCESSTAPTLVHGPGGVGKSVLASTLKDNLPEGSVTVVFDCFGNGSYRRPSAPRHRSKQGFVQLVNELAAHALCDPLIPSSTADDADYALAFHRRLSKAAEVVAATRTGALLAIVIDAADNAAMIADEMGERSFVSGLLREPLPQNVRLVATCRTERTDLLGLPAGYQDVPLSGFDLAETRAHLKTVYPDVSSTDASEFHNRTSSNPRVQAAVLDATNDIKEALTWLAPNPGSPGQALDAFIERQVAEIRDRQHGSAPEIDAICTGLAALRPMIPIRVLAELAKVHPSVVLSFVADLGRPLLIDGDTVQFRDEPTETWFRDHFRPTGASLDAFLERLSPIAEKDAYVAASLPALLFEANRFDDLVQLALSDDLLPDNALPSSQRNEVQRREIAQQRTHFALSAALRADRHFEAAQLALRLGALTAGRTRRLDLIRENTDLAARFLDPSVLEHLIATRSITAEWPNSNLPIEGALLAGAAGQSDQARNRLRSAMSWMYAWVDQARRNDTPSDLNDLDFLQIAWGLLNTDGPAACTRFLRGWRPRALAFDVGVDIARRLLDAGRDSDFMEFARCSKGKYLKFAVAHAASERDLQLDADIVTHLLEPVLNQDQKPQLSRNDDLNRRNRSGDPIHSGLTAASWLIDQAVSLEILAADKAAQLLRLYLPQDLGHLSGSWYDPDVWYPILGLTLCARLEGRSADATEFQGPRIREARERERYESSRELRTYRENVEPLTSWAVAWLDLLGNPGPENEAGFSQRISEFLRQEPPEWREERVDRTKINTVFTLIGRALARFPDIADHAQLLKFQAANDDVIARSTLTNVVRQTATNPLTHRLSSELARRCHQEAAAAREDASELAADFVQLSRATYRMSPDEAVVHFQAALEITNAIGDDAWSRWETFLAIANQAGQGTTNQAGKAYRLCQVAERLEPYLGDYISHSDVLATASRLSLPEALAAGSRWRDRRTAPIRDLANAILTISDLHLEKDPTAALSFLPLGDRFPDNHALASALETKLPDPTSAVIAYLQFRRPTPLTSAEQKDLLELTGVTQRAIERNDASLLRTSEATTSAFASDERAKKTWDDYKNLDLTTVDGWAKALDRSETGNSSTDLFDYIAATDVVSAGVLRAFKECPSVSFWDLSRLLDALGNHQLSMAAEAALDQVLIAQIPRFAPDILLVSWRAFSYENARTLANSDTNYEVIASRALAEQASFTTEQAYALASSLSRRLPVDEALQLFDLASLYFKDTAPLDSLDG